VEKLPGAASSRSSARLACCIAYTHQSTKASSATHYILDGSPAPVCVVVAKGLRDVKRRIGCCDIEAIEFDREATDRALNSSIVFASPRAQEGNQRRFFFFGPPRRRPVKFLIASSIHRRPLTLPVALPSLDACMLDDLPLVSRASVGRTPHSFQGNRG
jgi:hypothetical protein